MLASGADRLCRGFDISSVKLDIRDNEVDTTYETLNLLPAPAQGIVCLFSVKTARR